MSFLLSKKKNYIHKLKNYYYYFYFIMNEKIYLTDTFNFSKSTNNEISLMYSLDKDIKFKKPHIKRE
jgi:hypothetical protein